MENNNHILIYSQKTTPRLKYVFHLIFKDCLGVDFTITNNQDDYTNSENYKIWYGKEAVKSSFYIDSVNLLFESGIKEQSIQVYNNEEYIKYFFKTTEGVLPFDVFAAVFYLVSRYEEYLAFLPDEHKRYEAENSLAYQYDFLRVPLVNIWIKTFQRVLQKQFPDLIMKLPNYSYISTIDIDNVYKYKHKGVMRTVGGYLKSMVKLNKRDLIERTLVLFKKKNDPFDSYNYQLEVQKKFDIDVIYFYLLGDYGINDKNHPSNNTNFQKLIKHLSDYSQPAIHPSYGSYNNRKQIKIELNRLAKITHQEIFKSRQHYSILSFPDTYSTLLELGITDDYSMGYPYHNGFRASICTPFYWYNLDDELETNLKIHPYCLSEVTLRFNDETSIRNYREVAKKMIDVVKLHGGELITIFHNDTMGDADEWKDWNRIYEEIVELGHKI